MRGPSVVVDTRSNTTVTTVMPEASAALLAQHWNKREGECRYVLKRVPSESRKATTNQRRAA